jgi:hypothetical protein
MTGLFDTTIVGRDEELLKILAEEVAAIQQAQPRSIDERLLISQLVATVYVLAREQLGRREATKEFKFFSTPAAERPKGRRGADLIREQKELKFRDRAVAEGVLPKQAPRYVANMLVRGDKEADRAKRDTMTRRIKKAVEIRDRQSAAAALVQFSRTMSIRTIMGDFIRENK